VPNIIEIGHIQ